jgi:hypothetical protein
MVNDIFAVCVCVCVCVKKGCEVTDEMGDNRCFGGGG